MERIRVRARFVIGYADGDHVIYENGELVYAGDQVLYAGPAYPGEVDRTVEAGNALVSPGFIDLNALADIDTTIMNYDQSTQISAGMGWSEDYLRRGPHELVSPQQEAAKSRYALSQLIFNGITTAYPVTSLNYREWAETQAEFEKVAEIAHDLGLRVYLGPSYRSAVHIVQADGSRRRHWDEPRGLDGLRQAVEFIQQFDGAYAGLVRGLLVPSTVETCTPDLLRETRRWSDELGVPVRLHATQSYREFQLIQHDFGKTPIQYLDEIGFLGPRTILPHAIYVNGASQADCGSGPDLQIMRDSGLIVAHCPFALARGGVAMESFERFKQQGIRVGMGTDCFPSDMLMNLRLGSLACRFVERTHGVGSTADFFRAATTWPADWLGRPDLGRLASGTQADFFIARLDGFHIGQVDDPIRTLILNGSATDIHTVVINGRTVMENRGIPGLDTAAASRWAQDYYTRLKQSYAERDYLHRSVDELFPRDFRVVDNKEVEEK